MAIIWRLRGGHMEVDENKVDSVHIQLNLPVRSKIGNDNLNKLELQLCLVRIRLSYFVGHE